MAIGLNFAYNSAGNGPVDPDEKETLIMQNLLRASLTGAAGLLAWTGSAVAAPPAIQVPEPSSLALIAIGVAGVAYLKFRARK